MRKEYDVTALGELLIDFTENGSSGQGNPLLEANPGGAPCNVLAMLQKLGRKTAVIGKVGQDLFGSTLRETIEAVGINSEGLVMDKDVHTTLAFVHTYPDGDREFSFYRSPGADMMLRREEVLKEKIQKKPQNMRFSVQKRLELGFLLTPICGNRFGRIWRKRKKPWNTEWNAVIF